MNSLSHSLVRTSALAAVCFLAGAAMFGHAQTSEDQVAAQHATSAFRREDRGPDGRRGQGVYSSPDGNFAVLDLGESERYSVKGHSHAVYDFAAKKVFIVRFVPSTNSIYVDSETLR